MAKWPALSIPNDGQRPTAAACFARRIASRFASPRRMEAMTRGAFLCSRRPYGPPPSGVTPMTTTRIAIAGLGAIGRTLAARIARGTIPGTVLTAVAARDEAKAKAAAARAAAM